MESHRWIFSLDQKISFLLGEKTKEVPCLSFANQRRSAGYRGVYSKHVQRMSPTFFFITVMILHKLLKLLTELKPTVILQDLVMPDVNEFPAALFSSELNIKKCACCHSLITKEDPVIKAEVFALGPRAISLNFGQDSNWLHIRHHSITYTRLLERNDAYEKLLESQVMLNADLRNAYLYVTSLLPPVLTRGYRSFMAISSFCTIGRRCLWV